MARLLKIKPAEDCSDTETTASHERRLAPHTRTPPTHPAIRIHKDGLMRGTYKATAIAPSRILISTDPLSYPLDSRLEIEFLGENSRGSAGCRLPAIVSRRSLKGIELTLQPDKIG